MISQILTTFRLFAGAIVLLWPIAWHLDPGRFLLSHLDAVQFTVIEVAAAFCFMGAHVALTSKRRFEQGTGFGISMLSVFIGVALFMHFASTDALFIRPTGWLIALSVLTAILALFVTAKGSGFHFVLLIVGVLILGYAAQFFSGDYASPTIRLNRYIVYMTFGSDGFLGRAAQIISEVVVVFVLFGAIMNAIGANLAVAHVAKLAARRGRGAAIKVAILASALFGTISGSATSNVMTSGSFSIQGMRKLGLSGAQAGGVEAVASTMGQLIPPIMGAAAFLMADFTGLPYLEVAAAAALPAGLCVVFLLLNADLMARRLPPIPTEQANESFTGKLALIDFWYLLPVVTIIGSLITRPDQVPLAGIYGALAAVVSGVFRNGLSQTLKALTQSFLATAKNVSVLVATGSALGVIISVLAITGYDALLSIRIGALGEDNLFASLALCAVAAVILGTGMATTGVYIVVAIMLAPGLVSLGVPTVAAHFFVLYFGAISMITPPVAFAVLAASGLTGAGFYRTGFSALRFGWVLFVVPFLVVYFPGLVLLGSWKTILSDLGISFVILSLVCLALEGIHFIIKGHAVNA